MREIILWVLGSFKVFKIFCNVSGVCECVYFFRKYGGRFLVFDYDI